MGSHSGSYYTAQYLVDLAKETEAAISQARTGTRLRRCLLSYKRSSRTTCNGRYKAST